MVIWSNSNPKSETQIPKPSSTAYPGHVQLVKLVQSFPILSLHVIKHSIFGEINPARSDGKKLLDHVLQKLNMEHADLS